MKKIINLFLVACTMFGTAAGASWALQRMHAPAGEPVAATAPHAGSPHANSRGPKRPSESHEADPGAGHHGGADETSPPAALHPTYAPGVEETVRLASSLRDRAALVREREDQLATRHRQLELVIEHIRSERTAIDDLRGQLEAALKGAEDHMSEVQRQRAELDIKQQNIDGRVTEMQGHEKDNIKKMASMYDSMAAESAAKIIQHMADGGTMDTAVKLLSSMKERQAAKVLAEMSDPSLAAQLSERLKDLKHLRPAPKE